MKMKMKLKCVGGRRTRGDCKKEKFKTEIFCSLWVEGNKSFRLHSCIYRNKEEENESFFYKGVKINETRNLHIFDEFICNV